MPFIFSKNLIVIPAVYHVLKGVSKQTIIFILQHIFHAGTPKKSKKLSRLARGNDIEGTEHK